ncbi:glycoside hydrolase family 25 protein [Streptomyces sp. MK5]|uniref:glycoside hydrolase family 25 protein n=1 Tax=Streptomyces sp. MK5 TaxID=3064253 RepID=UPI00274238AB|nr:glycoside hydrolase family 25 protein [Streptomyces sp. MK5]
MIHGIDVSAYQSATYSTAGLDFVFTKVTEGLSYINPRWVQQRDRAKAAGLVWGAYHYPRMSNDPIKEADYFLRQVAWKPGDLIVLDWEGYDSANKSVPRSRQLAYRDAWLKYVKGKMPGHRVGMYANTDYWLHVDQTSNCGDFLWIATAGRPAGQPGIKDKWTIHQYSTAGGIDHDVANFPSRSALAAWAAGTPAKENLVADKNDVKVLWQTDGVLDSPDGAKDPKGNAYWTAESYLRYGYLQDRETNRLVRSLVTKLDAQTAAIAKLAGLVGSEVDTAEVVAAVQKAIADAVVKVDVDVTGTQTPGA